MASKGTFQCGTCNLLEEGLSDNEIIELSGHHFNGNHIDKDDLRKLKRCRKPKEVEK